MGDVLIDAATRRAGRRILRQLDGREVSAHALTHAHPDHQGASKEVCQALGIPLWCHEADADAMEQGTIPQQQPSHPVNKLIERFWLGPPYPVARRLEEGDVVAGFEVLHVPGHSAGHVAYWREPDRALIAGDVLTNIDTITGRPGLHEPKKMFTPDPARNRESARRGARGEKGCPPPPPREPAGPPAGSPRSSRSSSASAMASRCAIPPGSAASSRGSPRASSSGCGRRPRRPGPPAGTARPRACQ